MRKGKEMTIAELIYIIGYGVAFIMIESLAFQVCEKHKLEYDSVFFVGLFLAFLSWAVPIVWLGNKYLVKRSKR